MKLSNTASGSENIGDPHSPRKRRVWLRAVSWFVGSLVVLLVLCGVTCAFLLRSERFHNYLLHQLETQASTKLGVEVRLQNFSIDPFTLRADLYGLTVNGAPPYTRTTLLQVQHAEAGVRIVSLFRRKWYIDSIRIDKPIVQIYVDEKGVSNLPVFKKSGGPSNNNELFDLGVRHAVLNGGEVYYNNRPSQLEADLTDLDLNAAFNALEQRYSGSLSYSNGRFAYGGYRPLAHNLSARFSLTPSTLALDETKLSVGASQANLAATVNNYSSTPVVKGRYDIVLDGHEIAQVLRQPSIPAGLVHASGTLEYTSQPGKAFLDALAVTGDFSSSRLDVATPAAHAQIAQVSGHYSLASGIADIHDLRAALLGGDLTASGEVDITGASPHSHVKLALHRISLDDIRNALGRSAAKFNAKLSGTLNAEADAAWGKSIDDLVSHADVTIEGQASRAGAQSRDAVNISSMAGNKGIMSEPVPVQSVIHATYTNRTSELAFTDSYLRTPQTNLTLNGKISRNSSVNVNLRANDLREVETIFDIFRTPSSSGQFPPLGLAGTATFQGTVHGSISAPHINGQLSAANLEVKGSTWKSVRASLDAEPDHLSVQHAEFEPASRGHITLDASTQLTKWSYTPSSNVQVNLQASQLDVREIVKLTGQRLPATGTLSVRVSAHGTELNPVGNGSISLTNASVEDEPIQAFDLNFSGTGDEARGELSVRVPAGTLEGKITVQPKARTYTAQLTSGGIDLTKLEQLKTRGIDVAGRVSLKANGEGSFDNPQVSASIQIPKLVVHDQTIANVNLQAGLANHVADATLASTAVDTSIQAKARVELTGDYRASASIDTQAIELQPLLAMYAPSESAGLSGQTELHATLQGPLKDRKALEAHVTIPTLKLAYKDTVQLAAASPIHVDYKDGVINLQRGAIHGTDTDLQFQGSIPVASSAPMSLMLLGTVDLKLAQAFDPDVTSSGQIKFNINSRGAVSSGDIAGQIDIIDANFTSLDAPVGLSHANGSLTLSRDRLNIAKFEGAIGGGSVTAQGGVNYSPKMQFDLGVSARGVRMLYPQGMREQADADIRLTGTPENALLGGTVNLTNLSFTPAFDLSRFAGQFSGVSSPPATGFTQNLQLNLAVHSSNDFNLVSRALTIGGSANLQVRGTAADPVIVGRVSLTGGDVILNGNRFTLSGGTIQFVNPAETEPVVNLSVNTTIQQYNITLRFQGPVEQMQTQYTSDPALPQADIINLLAFGQTTEASAANPATPANQQAESLLASQVSSQVTSRISKIAGISQLSISPVLPGSTSATGANITIQQRVTGNLFITFSANVADTQSQTIQGQYQVSPRVAVSATRDPNGGFALDTLIKKTW